MAALLRWGFIIYHSGAVNMLYDAFAILEPAIRAYRQLQDWTLNHQFLVNIFWQVTPFCITLITRSLCLAFLQVVWHQFPPPQVCYPASLLSSLPYHSGIHGPCDLIFFLEQQFIKELTMSLDLNFDGSFWPTEISMLNPGPIYIRSLTSNSCDLSVNHGSLVKVSSWSCL